MVELYWYLCCGGQSFFDSTIDYFNLWFHYVTFRSTTSRHLLFHYVTSPFVSLRHLSFHYTNFRFTRPPFVTVRHVIFRSTTSRHLSFHYATSPFVSLRHVTFRSTASRIQSCAVYLSTIARSHVYLQCFKTN